ncbi:DUF4886 domain-containing protein [Ructibacterium gallinarum]|uniref:DUF4886 domain-containing protein n=1 Tax=Ructibacterium gallinarum TaxID=2779355 RepID=A0A9D5R8G3_9FIRM|nr:DUF4886 domain-containing protein [Ructibacterium gallinarum]MBE5039414.1 DUF4886 domain-containing protein [Ructibacterium gallinarum]
MKVLCIGNSFSQDATRYLHQIAEAAGENIKVFNLYIGGCSLERHWNNIENSLAEYLLEVNGESTGQYVTSEEMLQKEDWDVVTLQQVSQCSVDYATYQPYLEKIDAFVRKKAPMAKRFLHQTWAYAQDSPRLTEMLKYRTQEEMYRDLEAAYQKAWQAIQADGMIPSGKTFREVQLKTKIGMYRDGFHASLGIGRYVLGLTWYGYLTGKSVKEIPYVLLDEPAKETELQEAAAAVETVLQSVK